MFLLAGGLSLYQMRDQNVPLNYTDMNSIYASVEPLDTYYNINVESGPVTDATAWMTNVVQSSAGALNPIGETYPAKTADQNYTEYYSNITG